MTTIFLSSANEDRACADEIRQGLEVNGHTIWREPDFPTSAEQSYPYLIENAVLGSATLVLLWSQHAALNVWSKRHVLIAQRFFKPIVPVVLDGTALPNTLTTETPIPVTTSSCQDIVELVLPHLPAPEQTDALLTLSEQASHQYIRERREAIDQAEQMLQRGEHREEVLAVLEYLAHNDLMTGVREKAQEVLAAATQQQNAASPAPTRPQVARHQFGVRCKNGHVSYFDKRIVCSKHTVVMRAMRGLDELLLTCPVCQVEMAVDVDCEGYRE
jgi:hypothetical protein